MLKGALGLRGFRVFRVRAFRVCGFGFLIVTFLGVGCLGYLGFGIGI